MQHSNSPCYNGAQHPSVAAEAWLDFLSEATSTSESIYMIIDCAHDPRIYPALIKTLNTKCCLFTEEKISEAIKSVSPFLVKIKQMDEFIRWCIEEGVHRNWMVFFTSTIVHVTDLNLQFKRFSIAQGPDGKRYFFRFYDSRVLPEFLLSGEKDRSEFFRHCLKVWIPRTTLDGTFHRVELTAKTHIETQLCRFRNRRD